MTDFKPFLAIAVLAFGLLPVTTANAGPNCTCRFAGENYKTGDIMCIRGKLSRCEFVLNNTSWKTIAETCPQTNLLQSPVEARPVTVLARMQYRFSIK